MNRPTPAQNHLVEIVRQHPGIGRHQAAQAVGSHGSHTYGRRIIQRAVLAGRILQVADLRDSTGKRGWAALYLPEKNA